MTDPKGLATTYTLNGHGDTLTLLSPDTGTTTFTYDAASNLNTKLDARGVLATHTYDALNRLSQVAYPDETVTYTYDSCANGVGRLCRIQDKTGETLFTYDVMGRVATKSQVVGGITQAMSYQYNAAGQLSQVTTPSGTVIVYAYANGRPTSVTVNGQTLLDLVEHEPFGPVGGWRWGNSTTATPNFHTRIHDRDFRATRVLSDRPLASGTPAIDKAIGWHAGLDIITSMTDPATPALNATYSYDALNRIELATQGGNTWGYTLDGVGNRLSTTQNAAATTYAYATGSHRLQSLSGATARTYSVDAVGNMTSDGQSTWNYGGNNRPTQFVVGANTTAVLINALGQRVRKGDTGFVYDEQGRLQGEYGPGGALIQETIWLNDLPVGIVKDIAGSKTLFYAHADHLGSPRSITRHADNSEVWRWENTEPFGANSANENPGGLGSFAFNLRFPGQYFDAETGKHYNYFRDYDPGTGRYVESDPIGLKGGINTYGYVSGNPLRYSDPTGQVVPALIWCASNPACGAGAVAIVAAIIRFPGRGAGGSGSGGSSSAQPELCPDQNDSFCSEQQKRLLESKRLHLELRKGFSVSAYNGAARGFNSWVERHNAACPNHQVEPLSYAQEGE